MRGASPSKGMLKRMFDPANLKKKEKSALGVAKSGGPNIHKPTTGVFGKFGKGKK